MGRRTSGKLLFTAAVATGALLAFLGSAEAGSLTFLSPREAMMRHSSGPVRGQVKSMTTDEVVMVLRTGVEKSYPMSGVTSIIAADKSFQYMPAQQSFDEFLSKAASIRGVTVVLDDAADGSPGAGGDSKSTGTVSNGYARAIGMQPPGSPQVGASAGFVQSDGFAGSSQRPQGLARLDSPAIAELDTATVDKMKQDRLAAEADAASQKFALPGGGVVVVQPSTAKSGFALPEAGEEVLICSNPKCQKEVPGAKYGQQCPHCGIIWARQSNAEAMAATAPSGSAAPGAIPAVVDPKNPFARAAAPPPPAPMALPQVAQAPPSTPAAVQPQGFSLETIPWWGKILGFGASIMVLMWVMGRR